MKYLGGALLGALALSAPVIGYAQTPMVVGVPASSTVLRAGAAIPIRLLKELTTEGKHLRAGDRFDIEVAEPVLLQGQTVIPTGSHGVGEVTSVRNKGMWGKSGNIEARLLYIRVGDRQIRITGNFNDKGVTGTAGVVGAIAFVPVAGFFLTGTSARIASGSQVTAFLDEDVPVVLPAGTVINAPVVATAPAGSAPFPAATASPAPAAITQPINPTSSGAPAPTVIKTSAEQTPKT